MEAKNQVAFPAETLELVKKIIARYPEGKQKSALLPILHLAQAEWKWMRPEVMDYVASLLNIQPVEVYEVATFYHHFEVVRGNDPVADITVRVCDGVACELAGAQNLLGKLPAILGNPNLKVVAAPCVGRCEQAPVAVVHQYPVIFATTDKVKAAVSNKLTTHPLANDDAVFEPAELAGKGVSPQGENQAISPDYVGYESYRAKGGYALAKEIVDGKRDAEKIGRAHV